MNAKKRNILLITGIVVVVIIVVIIISGPFIMRPLRFEDRFNFDENSLREVTEYFENSTTDVLTEYCNIRMPQCGYYCRNVNPEHDFCDTLNYTMPERGFR